ncbi:MAG: twin-arginine translocation signal domain-containing protein [Comamonas sp.]
MSADDPSRRQWLRDLAAVAAALLLVAAITLFAGPAHAQPSPCWPAPSLNPA